MPRGEETKQEAKMSEDDLNRTIQVQGIEILAKIVVALTKMVEKLDEIETGISNLVTIQLSQREEKKRT